MAPITRSQAVVRVIDALGQDYAPPQRLLLEDIAYLARKPESQNDDCRVMAAFMVDNSQDWMLELHESLVHLQARGHVRRTDGRYTLTQRGKDCAESLRQHPSVDGAAAIKRIRVLAARVRAEFRI